MGYKKQNQVTCCKYFTQLRKMPCYKGYTDSEFRYRIPSRLLEDIIKCLSK